MQWFTTLASLSAVVAAIAAAAAAIANYVQARAARGTLQVQLFLAFSERYGSPEFSEAIIRLLSWYKKHPEGFADIWHEAYERREKDALELEQARRALNRFFTDIGRLYEAKQISREIAYVLLGHFGLDVYYRICHPMWKKHYGDGAKDYALLLKEIRSKYTDWNVIPDQAERPHRVQGHPEIESLPASPGPTERDHSLRAAAGQVD